MHMTTLGASFLNRYRALRKNEGDRDLAIEIEYNFGRAFHGLGQFRITFAHRSNEMLNHTLESGVLNLAVKHYRQALGEVEASMGEAEDPEVSRPILVRQHGQADLRKQSPQTVREKSPAREAAYNLMSIFLLTGSPLLAKNISDKWLAV
jgi:hypothetical protein